MQIISDDLFGRPVLSTSSKIPFPNALQSDRSIRPLLGGGAPLDRCRPEVRQTLFGRAAFCDTPAQLALLYRKQRAKAHGLDHHHRTSGTPCTRESKSHPY